MRKWKKTFSESLTLKESSISDGVITGICILKPISKKQSSLYRAGITITNHLST